ncbi:MAG: GIY-YIG nuclease family protein [Patescibacteria group bacterium]
MYWLYILKSLKNDKYYIGQTKNLEQRLTHHNQGKNQSTKYSRPWELIYNKEFSSRNEVMKFEKYLKSLKNRDYLKKKIIDAG